MKPSVGVAIIGGSGYGAGELLRYLTAHPQVRVASVVSSSQSGELISKAHPHLSGFYSGLKFESAVNWEQLKTFGQCVVFLALPHGHSGKFIHALGNSPHKDLRVIDLAADFRLSAESIHTRTYPDVQFDAPLRESFVYGLPELSQEKIKSARRITNPGCLATASILAAAPLIENYREQIVGSLCFDAKTGTSGAGRAAQDSMHHPLRHGNFEAYKILCHR
ncbi:MAG: N-acetyl-gamma-glutamyl-phosphate reductase, partial [Deltaproteobacteria bacterium]|nr:N-acetyl-gamma-glutamyl-phosphate reductase [Deltaproteobacteria bacterium]